MKSVKFSDVKIGAEFTYNDNQYTKLQQKKISCCKSINASLVSSPNQKILIKEDETVEVVE